jgi:hypothetical protein
MAAMPSSGREDQILTKLEFKDYPRTGKVYVQTDIILTINELMN